MNNSSIKKKIQYIRFKYNFNINDRENLYFIIRGNSEEIYES